MRLHAIKAAPALLALAIGLSSASDAFADSSSFTTEGVTIRLLTEPPDAEGRLRGTLLFDLEPGWKTYWIDPGMAGLAPTFDFGLSRNVATPELDFPAPRRFSEGDLAFNGYDEPIGIAIDTAIEGDGVPHLSVNLFVGICRDICVPVSARLDSEPDASPSPADANAIDRTFLSLPGETGEVLEAREADGELVVSGVPSDVLQGDLFVSGPGWSFGRARTDGRDWRIPVRARPKAGAPSSLEAILVEAERARSFRIDFP